MESASLASGDDNVVVTRGKDAPIIWNRLEKITSQENKPEYHKTGIILKSADFTHNSVSFLSKIYIYPNVYAPQFDRFVRRGASTMSNTDLRIIRNSVLGDL